VTIATELGGVLKVGDSPQAGRSLPPSTHRMFSTLAFKKDSGSGSGEPLVEGEEASEMDINVDAEEGRRRGKEEAGGWLENDDIEEF
jgi:hypothetical protein